jgi:alkylhydroperoxidase/carboxymuconolactone decarboxylase family protein YurZ
MPSGDAGGHLLECGTTFHVQAAKRASATREEVISAILIGSLRPGMA